MADLRVDGRSVGPLMWGASVVQERSVEQAALRLPSGTVTFMLTDLEGSTRLWEAAPEAMPGAVARHYELLDAAVALHGGMRPVEQGEGDSTVAVFSRASDALAAALDVQRALLVEPWPPEAVLRLRVALHTAEAQLRDHDNYVGEGIIRCARLRAIAHGGQVLLSRTAHDLVADRLPHGAELVDLGVHRLRDLSRREHVFGLQHADLQSEVVVLRSLDGLPNNLPTPLASFVGRHDELAELDALLAESRLLTLTGAGGCGKTRLALQGAADAIDRYADGVWWIELDRLREPALLTTTVLTASGLREIPGQSPLDVLLDHFRGRQALLILDNCEHLLTSCAELVDELLRSCPSLTILTTSRSSLGVTGERAWRVPSMALPADAQHAPAQALAQSDAGRLFVDRARLVRPNFALTMANAPAVAQICRDLDGMPLAIELATTRLRMLTPEQIAAGLEDRLRLLTGGSATATARQRTLRASIDWSHELLTDNEQTLLRRLAVFVGGWTLDAAEEVCSGGAIDGYAILDLLGGLVDASLVTASQHEAEMRYGLAGAVRQYAAEQLAASAESSSVHDRHRDYFVALAETTAPVFVGAGANDAVVRRLAVEMPNVRVALHHAAASDRSAALRIADTLGLFWLFTGRYREGDSAYALALAGAAEHAALDGRVIAGRANLALYAGDAENAPPWAQQALAIGEASGDLGVQARALDTIGVMVALGDPAGACELLARSAELATQCGDDWCRIDALQILAMCWIFQDEFETARALLHDAYATAARSGYRWGLARHGMFLAMEAEFRGRLDECRQLLADAIQASDDAANPVTHGYVNASTATIDLAQGEAHAARQRAAATLQRTLSAGAVLAVGWVAESLGRSEVALGDFEAARAHLQLAVAAERHGFAYMLGSHLVALGTLERLERNPAAARGCASEAQQIARRVGSELLEAHAERVLARVALDAGATAEAEVLAHDALRRLEAGGFALYISECLDILAAVAAAQESFEESARLLGSAAAARRQLGIVRFPPEPDAWAMIEHAARENLESAYDDAFAAGAALSMADAIAYARRTRGARKRPSRGWDSLTPTELEVVRHVATGLTNPQIGERMFIARGTVKVHLAHIFAKLAFTTRAQLAAEATRRGAGVT